MIKEYLPKQGELRPVDIRRAIRAMSIDMLRMQDTYPSATSDLGNKGDVAINSDSTRMAIYTGSQWKSWSLDDQV